MKVQRQVRRPTFTFTFPKISWKEVFLKSLCNLERHMSFNDNYLTYREEREIGNIPERIWKNGCLNVFQELIIWSVAINIPELTELFIDIEGGKFGLQDRLMCATMYKRSGKILERAQMRGQETSSIYIEGLYNTKKMFLKQIILNEMF